MHRTKFIFTHGSLKPQEETVVRISWVVKTVLVPQEVFELSEHISKMMPVLYWSGPTDSSPDPDDQTDVLHGNFGDDAVKSGCGFRHLVPLSP